MKAPLKAAFISHGGGPLPLLGDPGHQEMVNSLRRIAADHPRPNAILVVSAHWEEAVPTITAGPRPGLIYDYYGFPPAAYAIDYPCPGEPALAARLWELLNAAGIEARLDERRGFDHGLFVPLKIMYPAADIPCLQLSLVNNLDPALHMTIGQALGALSGQNLLLLGSGFSFHNLRAFFSPPSAESRRLNLAFEDWLRTTCRDPQLSEADRAAELGRWSEAPGARYCHPREEHLLPLHVCYGAVRSPAAECIELNILDKACSLYLW